MTEPCVDSLTGLHGVLKTERAKRVSATKPQEVKLPELPPIAEVVLEELAAAGVTALNATGGESDRPRHVGLICGANSATAFRVAIQVNRDGSVRVICACSEQETGREGGRGVRTARTYTQELGGPVVCRILGIVQKELDLEAFREVIRTDVQATLRNGAPFGRPLG